MEIETRNLLNFAKKIVSNETYLALKKIRNEDEFAPTVKYALISSFEAEHYRIEKEIQDLEEKRKDVFFAKNKAILIPSKIKHFGVEFDKPEFYKLINLISETRNALKNV